ncbi:hypothetical protein SHIRM173S_07425 [Streptomyces hirsutus]
MPVRWHQSTRALREASRCGLSVSGNGMRMSGIRDGPTFWYGTWVCARSLPRCLDDVGSAPVAPAAASSPRTSAAEVPAPDRPAHGVVRRAPSFMYRLERMCHSWPPDCQSCSPFAYAATAATSCGARPFSRATAGTSVNAVCSNWCSREVRMSLTVSAACWVVQPKKVSRTRTPLLFSPSSSTSRW